jgi:hypothetical protein
VQGGVYDAFTKRLAEAAGAMKVADGFEPGAVIGPLIDMKAVEKVEAHIADALKKSIFQAIDHGRPAGRLSGQAVAPLLRRGLCNRSYPVGYLGRSQPRWAGQGPMCSVGPPSTASIKRPVRVSVSAHGSAKDECRGDGCRSRYDPLETRFDEART